MTPPIAYATPLDEVAIRLLREPDPRDRVAVLRHNLARLRWLREQRRRDRNERTAWVRQVMEFADHAR